MSTLAVNNITPANPGSEKYFLAKAWVNFNGTGTVAIRASGNVSSITDEGVARYVVNFTAAMSDTNYVALSNTSGGGNYILTQNSNGTVTAPSTSSINIWSVGVVADPVYANLAFFR